MYKRHFGKVWVRLPENSYFSHEFKCEKPLVFNHKIKVAFRGRTSERDKVFYSTVPVEDSATECGVHVLAVTEGDATRQV